MQSVVDTIRSFFSYLLGLITDLGKLIKSYFDYVVDFWTDVFLSLEEFIADIAVNVIDSLTMVLTMVLDYASGLLSIGSGAISSVSQFADYITDAFNSLSPCVRYALSQTDLSGDFKILSAAISVFMVLKLIKMLIPFL
ncbi:MAG: hypothetical protein K9L60_14505 [Methylovulum sp.]|nr:hypothetical protein [Methylovulum sp.]